MEWGVEIGDVPIFAENGVFSEPIQEDYHDENVKPIPV